MKITPEVLQKQWDSINYKDGGFLQIDIDHPLEWHVGYQSVSQKTLLLISDAEIGMIESSKSMAVRRGRREADNRWTLAFELLRNEQQDVFLILCCDIIEHSQKAENSQDALSLVISRYKQWSRLLESQKSVLMDEHKRKGLIGELIFLNNQIDDSTSPLMAVQGWVGADGADQDFVYADCWYEIKSTGLSSSSVIISSLEQLDCEDDGELVVIRIDKTAPKKAGAFSLNDIVRQICDKLAADVGVLDLFQAKLSAYGYMDLNEYSEPKYYCSRVQRYTVDESFPKLTRKIIPEQILSSHYELNLTALADWQKE